jgi:glutathione S-transferase
MRLVGRYDSPFVRRVGVSLHVLDIRFELLPLSPFSEATNLRRYASIGRMPVLVLDNGETLIESAAILDYLDELVGADKALLPTSGPARRRSLRILASATAACEKAIAVNYERRRPADKIFDHWISRCHLQLEAALTECERFRQDWPACCRLMQADITTACMFGYVRRVEPALVPPGRFPGLELLSRDCELHPAFIACPENGDRSALPA